MPRCRQEKREKLPYMVFHLSNTGAKENTRQKEGDREQFQEGQRSRTGQKRGKGTGKKKRKKEEIWKARKGERTVMCVRPVW